MYKAYKTKLDPNQEQALLLAKSCGVARWAYNWGLRVIKEALDNKQKPPSAFDLKKILTKLKSEKDFEWISEVCRYAPDEAILDLGVALKNFFSSRSGKRKGIKVGFPKFKSKIFGQGSYRVFGAKMYDERHIQIPKIGVIRLFENNYIPLDKRINSVTITRRANQWYASCLIETDYKKSNESEKIIGVDVGISNAVTLSDGTKYQLSKGKIEKLNKIIGNLNKKLARQKKLDSNRRNKTKLRLSKLHKRVSDLRITEIHKITDGIIDKSKIIFIETLNVSGMMKNHNLAGSLQQTGLAEIHQQLVYKAKERGVTVYAVDRWYPSSKKCSNCGKVNEITLSDREWTCKCGITHDRDFNAAKNLAALSQNLGDGNGHGECVRPDVISFEFNGRQYSLKCLASKDASLSFKDSDTLCERGD